MAKSKGTGPVALIVLDGWGWREATEGNAIALGKTPTWDALVRSRPVTLLDASGLAVGLPEGQMGNSEVGHLNMGAGRVVRQDLVRISQAMDDGSFVDIPELADLCRGVRDRDGTLHLIGLIGTGGVHAHHRHWLGALDLARHHRVPRVTLHAFLDGRDTPPTSGAGFMQALGEAAAATTAAGVPCRTGSLVGRYYVMDRDHRWARTRLGYDAMVHGIGTPITDPVQGIRGAYARGETDEFIKPMVVQADGKPVSCVRDGDGVFCLNFRADRMRQICRALAIDDFDGWDIGTRPRIDLVTMTEYDHTFGFKVAFPPVTLSRIVAEVVSDAGKTMLRTAETEKYAHVTYFFNCGIETPFPGEDRTLIDSPKVATYDLQPEMSAAGVTDVLCAGIAAGDHDFILCNFANGDMVGHTGVLPAAVEAVETVDRCLERILLTAQRVGATVLITADHGNCEIMIDPDTGGPHTAHTTNPVPFILAHGEAGGGLRSGGRLSDIGPTLLSLLDLPVPAEMTGRDLREEG